MIVTATYIYVCANQPLGWNPMFAIFAVIIDLLIADTVQPQIIVTQHNEPKFPTVK